jgi:hypothetical protein
MNKQAFAAFFCAASVFCAGAVRAQAVAKEKNPTLEQIFEKAKKAASERKIEAVRNKAQAEMDATKNNRIKKAVASRVGDQEQIVEVDETAREVTALEDGAYVAAVTAFVKTSMSVCKVTLVTNNFTGDKLEKDTAECYAKPSSHSPGIKPIL